jgi:hypothetical protein
MSLGNLFSSLAPVAAGFAFPGYALAAGAATGAGIAALRKEDPLMGAVTGGLGGYGGGQLGTAAQNVTKAGLGSYSAGPVQGMGSSLAQNVSQVPNVGAMEAAKTLVNNPGDVISNLGGGDMTKGALKAGAIGLPAVAGAMVPDMPKTTGEMNQYKYDPNRRLNLNQPTGLRLLQEGGYLETGGKIGDGMSDEIMGTIDNTQPVRLSDGEFVIPADVVSHLGNGSSDAGAEQLYSMMDRIRKARTGNERQGIEITPERLMPV